MKIKFFILMVLFLGIGAISYAQTETAAPAATKDTPAQVAPEQGKTAESPGHQTTEMKAGCKWVDANGDGKCDTCGKTEAECKEMCKTESMKSCDPAACPHSKEGAKPAGCCTSKDGKK